MSADISVSQYSLQHMLIYRPHKLYCHLPHPKIMNFDEVVCGCFHGNNHNNSLKLMNLAPKFQCFLKTIWVNFLGSKIFLVSFIVSLNFSISKVSLYTRHRAQLESIFLKHLFTSLFRNALISDGVAIAILEDVVDRSI